MNETSILYLAIAVGLSVLWAIFCVWLVRWALRRRREEQDVSSLRTIEEHGVRSVATLPVDVKPWGGKTAPACGIDLGRGIEQAIDELDADIAPLELPWMLVNARLKALEPDQLSYDLPRTAIHGPEADRLAEIRKQAADGKTIKRQDILWALGMIGRLATPGLIGPKDIELLKDAAAKLVRSTPQEFQFPVCAALIDRMACQAIPLRFAGRLFPEKETELANVSTQSLLLFTPPAGLTDAVLVIRPWIRPHATTPTGLVDILCAWSIEIFVDREKVLPEHPVEEFLVGPDGFGCREQAFALPRARGLLEVGAIEDLGSPLGVPDPEGLRPGWFLTRDQTLEVRLRQHARELYGPVLVRTGLVAALYTTKAPY